jgi:hypothetical protein
LATGANKIYRLKKRNSTRTPRQRRRNLTFLVFGHSSGTFTLFIFPPSSDSLYLINNPKNVPSKKHKIPIVE